jgi:Tfp pilus assembly protein PilF
MLPGGTEAGQNAYALGLLAYNRERYDEAEPWFKKTIAVYDKIAPGSVRQAYAVEYLGRIAARRGQVDAARAQLQQALAIRAKAAPGSLDEAAGQWQVGEFELDQEQWTRRAMRSRARNRSRRASRRTVPTTPTR